MRSRDSGNSDEFIREVDEAVRQDRWMAVWKEYNVYIVGAVLAVVVGTTAGVGWQSYQENQRSTNAKELADATALLAEDKPAEAAQAFATLAERVGGGVAVVSTLRGAEAQKQAGDAAAKLTLLDGLAKDADAEPLYQRLAALLSAQESFDDGDADALIGEIEQAATPDNPWRASLIELKAVALMKAGRTEEARATLETLLDGEGTPANLARRAAELLKALGGPIDDDSRTISQNSSDEADPEAALGAEGEAKE